MKWRLREKFKGFWATASSTLPKRREFWMRERSWIERCRYYDRVFMEHPLAKSQILTLAGQFVADGVFLEASTDEEPHGARAEDALHECEKLNDKLNMPTLLYNTVINMAKYGSCFWEKTTEPTFETRIIPQQEAIEPALQDDNGEITAWRQGAYGKETARWTQDEIIHFSWNTTTYSWPYGTSLLVGLDTEFETLEKLEQSIKDFMEKTAFPKELYQIGDKDWNPTATDISSMKSKIKNWSPGEAFVTNAPIDYKPGGVGPKAIANLDDVMNFYKMQCVDGLLTPPVSLQYSSTYASSKEMAKTQRANLILPLQRIITWNIRETLYKPYLESLGYSVKLCPTMNFEPPDANFVEEATTMAQLVSAGILTPEIAAEELGYGDRLEEMKQQKLEAQQEQMNMLQKKMEWTTNQKKAEPVEQTSAGSPKPNTD